MIDNEFIKVLSDNSIKTLKAGAESIYLALRTKCSTLKELEDSLERLLKNIAWTDPRLSACLRVEIGKMIEQEKGSLILQKQTAI